ncbi:MAG TPA: hypothetical protein VL129_00265 [Pseudomonas sp.]|uniref:hypothetical protein n=1 Tax=Pseudomonas sp. TaxID=306 RepID=UPI002BDBE022|nr:hypothetical protein [Pseudomonas sp.]HTO17572.1 hypothetical protein [Pseudomonas sp.]
MFRKLVLASAIALTAVPAQAALFEVELIWDDAPTETAPYKVAFNTAEDAIDVVDVDYIRSKWTGFNENANTAIANIKFRGVPITLTHKPVIQNGQTVTQVILDIPSLGINGEAFTDDLYGGDDALDKLADYLVKVDGDREILTEINKAAVANTGFDPVAGNPNSLMASMVGTIHGLTNTSITGTNQQDIDNQWDLGIRYGSQTVAGNEITSIHLPLAYTFKLDWLPGHRLQFRMPISHTEINSETNNYSLQLGFGWTIPLIDGLETTPAIDYGIAGSGELMTAGILRALSLTTRFDFSLLGQNFTLTNSLAKIDSVRFEYEDEDEDTGITDVYVIDYDLSNKAMTNGVAWHVALPWKLATQVYLRDTRFYGDTLYSEQNNELGVNFGWSASTDTNTQFFVGASYQRHDKSEFDGARLNVGLTF